MSKVTSIVEQETQNTLTSLEKAASLINGAMDKLDDAKGIPALIEVIPALNRPGEELILNSAAVSGLFTVMTHTRILIEEARKKLDIALGEVMGCEIGIEAGVNHGK